MRLATIEVLRQGGVDPSQFVDGLGSVLRAPATPTVHLDAVNMVTSAPALASLTPVAAATARALVDDAVVGLRAAVLLGRLDQPLSDAEVHQLLARVTTDVFTVPTKLDLVLSRASRSTLWSS